MKNTKYDCPDCDKKNIVIIDDNAFWNVAICPNCHSCKYLERDMSLKVGEPIIAKYYQQFFHFPNNDLVEIISHMIKHIKNE